MITQFKILSRPKKPFKILDMTKCWFLISIILLWLPLIVEAESVSFNPNYIISEDALTDYQSMTIDEIQDVLTLTNSALKNYITIDTDGKRKSASEIIYRVSQKYQINPRFLLVLLQREKSLITKKEPTQDDLNWAMGFACYDNEQPVSKFRGFAIQIDRAAWRFRYYLEHPWQFRFRVNQKTKTLVNWKDRIFTPQYNKYVTPENLATASLYNYAPHIYDNWLFWKIWNWEIWQKWFPKKKRLPDGTLVRVLNDKGVWLIQNGKRRPFYSRAVFLASYNFNKVIKISPKELEEYEIGKPMTFSNYSLLKTSTGDVFLLVDGVKRKISSPIIFRKIGFHPEEINLVDDADLNQYPEGKPITTPYPNGALLQDKSSGAVYYVKDETKYPIIDKIILENNFPYNQIIKTNLEELNEFITGEPIKFNDGTLIKSKNKSDVYVIVQGKRLPIINQETFEGLGYLWENILTVSEQVLAIHPLGEALDINKIQ